MAFRHVSTLVSTSSNRVKALEFHPTEPMLASALYDGMVQIFNTNDWSVMRTIRIEQDKPVRCVKWMPSLQWIIAAGDNLSVSAYDVNSGVQTANYPNAHTDFIRALAVHPTQPYVLSCSDDRKVKLFNLEKGIALEREFEGHEHFVMDVKFNPKDPSTFATASLDTTIKFWSITSPKPRFTLKGHTQGVNCIEFFPGSDKPYIASGSDDFTIKIWDYQTKGCVATLQGHKGNITALKFHPVFPLLISTSEDEMLLMWNSMTYQNETVFNYNKKRGWAIDALGNQLAIGFDTGMVVLQLGRSSTLISMEPNGRSFWAKNSTIYSANFSQVTDAQDGAQVEVFGKEVATSEIYPGFISFNSTGKSVAIVGDNQYSIFSALAWRSKAFGQGKDLAWGIGDIFAIRESKETVSVHVPTKAAADKTYSISPSFDATRIFGGFLLGVAGDETICFYTWDTQTVVRQIDVKATNVWWSPTNQAVAIATEDSIYFLQLNSIDDLEASEGYDTTVGSPSAFSPIIDFPIKVKSGFWSNEAFFYNDDRAIWFYSNGRSEIAARVDRALSIVGYVNRNERIFLCDEDYNFVSYKIPLEILDLYATGEAGDLSEIPAEWKARAAAFLEESGKLEAAFEVADTEEKRFELAIKMNDIQRALDIAKRTGSMSQWTHLASMAMKSGEINILETSLSQAGDESMLLLLYSAMGDSDKIRSLAEKASDSKNVSFAAYFALGEYKKCIDLLIEAGRLPEAAMMARKYLPERMGECAQLWKDALNKKGQTKLAEAIANPAENPQLFGIEEKLD